MHLTTANQLIELAKRALSLYPLFSEDEKNEQVKKFIKSLLNQFYRYDNLG